MADEDVWKLSEDGLLNVEQNCKTVIYHPNSNVIIAIKKSSEVIVVDVNSGVTLRRSSLSAKPNSEIHGAYIPEYDKILFTDGGRIGIRRDYSGVLLLDTILQTPVSKPGDVVKVELPLSEAVVLQTTLRSLELSGVDHKPEVMAELGERIKEGMAVPKKGTKAQKWSTVCLELPHAALKAVCTGLVQELKRQNKHVPALSIASAVNEHLNCLLPALPADEASKDRAFMFSEAARRDTFGRWPHMNYKWALPDEMAQAGFYHQPNSTGDDRAMCFTCSVCLVCWEPTDEPWSEHERHSPVCPFVRGEYTQNVPLSVTYATLPAAPLLDEGDSLSCVSTSSVPELVATATRSGQIVLWNVARQLKREVTFYVSAPSALPDGLQFSDILEPREEWSKKKGGDASGEMSIQEIEEITLDIAIGNILGPPDNGVELTAVAVVGRQKVQGRRQPSKKSRRSGRQAQRPLIVAGITVNPADRRAHSDSVWGSPMVRAMNDVNEASNRESQLLDIMKVREADAWPKAAEGPPAAKQTTLYLMVYALHCYSPAPDEGADDGGGGGGGCEGGGKGQAKPKKVSSGTGTTASTSDGRQEKSILQDIFLSKFLYDVPMIEDVGSDTTLPAPHECTGDLVDSSSAKNKEVLYQLNLHMLGTDIGGAGFDEGSSSVGVPFYEACPPSVLLKASRSSKNHDDTSSKNVADESVCSKINNVVPLQGLPVPSAYVFWSDLSVLEIHPTKDGGHIVVLLGRKDWKLDDSPMSPITDYLKNANDGEDVEMDVDLDFSVDAELDSLASNPKGGLGFYPKVNGENAKISANGGAKQPPAGALLVYALDMENEALRLVEEPVNVLEFDAADCPRQIAMLPLREQEDGVPIKGSLQGLAALVCADGVLRLLNLASFKIVSKAPPKKPWANFISATYCSSLERLCALSDRGSLHFFVIGDGAGAECAGSSTTPPHLATPQSGYPLMLGFSSDGSSTSSSTASPSEQLLVNRLSLGLAELQQLRELTMCGNLSPCYAATVPPCWSEMMQAQKQRRHPQHLQQGDELQHTRSWRLQNDQNSWDEHIFEITLPRSCCIGHVDVKFSLHSPCPSPPHIEVTLLKQNPCGIGRKAQLCNNVEETVNFNIGQASTSGKAGCKLSSENPVTDEAFHRYHNTEVLCGPVSLASCLDLSEHHGIATLTSPRLIKMRGRTLLLHVKALGDGRDPPKDPTTKNCFSGEKYSAGKKVKYKGGKAKMDQMLDEFPVQNGSGPTVDRLASAAATKKMENQVGCDWLYEVSITIRRTKPTNIPNDRMQRCAMLESNAFAERLLKLACLEGSERTPAVQGLALDVLVWVASVRLACLRPPGDDAKQAQVEFVRIVERRLVPLVKHCLLLAGRSIAHKCVKLVLVCSEGMKNVLDAGTVTFDSCVLQALLEWLPSVWCVHSAGTLRWFLLLLCRVMALDVSATTGQTCASLLARVAEELRARSNPYHLLLRTRFGLYGTPFEAEMFDVDPPVSAKFSSTPITYASVVNQDIGGTSTSAATTSTATAAGFGMPELIDLRELLGVSVLGCGMGDGKMPQTKLRSLTFNHYMKGLLEVEPLHFTCYAASDGTKMEKLEPGATPGTSGTVSVPVGNVMESFNFVPTSSGTKKADSDFISFCEDIKKEEMWNSLELKISGESGSIVTLYGGEQKIIPVKCDGEDEIRHAIQFGVAQSSGVAGVGTEGDGGGGGGPQCDKDSSSSSSSMTDPAPLICTQTLPYDDAYPPLSHITQSLVEGDKKHADPTKKAGHVFADASSVNLPWQKLLKVPSQHMLVIERMHSGARRFVVLDFGSPVLLTDLLIPACSDLVSLSIDIWCHAEESDGQRLVVASDIGVKSLVMSDLQPAPICRFLKITTIGRYGMNTTRCKIPVGSFYGHVVVLPGEGDCESASVAGISEANIQTQLMLLSALFEDTHCRYSLASSKLQDLLTPLLTAETPNVVNMYHYLQKEKELDKACPSADTQKILVAYQECVTFQHQLNLVRNVMRRLEAARDGSAALPDSSPSAGPQMLKDVCTDKLRVLGEGLLDVLLYLVYEIGPVPRLPVSMYALFDQQLCEQLFGCLCVREDTRMQLQACSLLARMCGLQPWWGGFLANTLARLFSSQHTTTFPQDRVFILLTYLGRKSLAAGATCCSVLDGVLALLAELLAPLSAPHQVGFLRAEMDLSLLGWVLLFLSSCFDMTSGSAPGGDDPATDKAKDKDQGVTSRWDFIQGEVAMQRKMATTNRNSASKSYRRKLQKRLMHHKQQLEDLEIAKKAFYASTQVQALTALSNQAANLSNKLEVALKQQEQFYRKTLKQHTSKHFKDILQMRRLDGPQLQWRPGRQERGTAEDGGSAEAVDREVTICLPQARCLPVARGLVSLVLQMDFTCNVDVFLLACKVVARIVASARPRVHLADLMSEQQLLRLLRLSVWCDGGRRAWWGGPWAPHAICCLLQDVLEGVRLLPAAPDTPSQEPDEEPSTSSVPTASTTATTSVPGPSCGGSKSGNGNGGSFQLPSVLESDDSELEDFLDDILERGRSLLRKSSGGRPVVAASSHVSTAVDARLEYGVELGVEVLLRKLTALGAHNLPYSVNAGIPPPPEAALQLGASSWDQGRGTTWQQAGQPSKLETLPMLTRCFDQVFSELQDQTMWTNLELVLQMWLTLNIESLGEGSAATFDSMSGPMIELSQPAVSGLIAAFAWNSGISLRAWCLAFQALTMVANTLTPITSDACPDAEGRWSTEDVERMEDSQRVLARAIVQDQQFMPMMLRFLSGSGVNTGAQLANSCAGPTVCQALHDLVMRLEVRCDVISPSSELGNALKRLLLELVHQLVQPSGALAARQGPLDAQCKLVEMMLNLSFSGIDSGLTLAVTESVGMLVYSYILGGEKVTCPSVLDTRVNASSCFRGLFASVLGESSKQSRPTSWDNLLCCLLKLCNNLVQTPLEAHNGGGEKMDVSESAAADDAVLSHGDKRKADKMSSSDQTPALDVKVPCLADKVLQNERTMRKLLGALAGCSGSTLAMLIGSYAPSEQLALGDVGEPLSVGDAVFQLLTVLSLRATSPDLVLVPLFNFLSTACGGQPQAGSVGVMQLSEPLLWFILRILDAETSLLEFNKMGGIEVICESLVRSNQELINSHPSLVSIVLQHLSHPLPTACLNLKKASSPLQTNEGLVNFAPLGTISSSNPTTQPADVLIQASPPHRRARTPAWSYHFYPDEMWVDLTVTLPCAVLLKEVQLQPHLTSLATCPSAVAVEVSRDSSSVLVPICAPLPTSGLTYIVMSLPQPEVVTSVLLRLYKPHDSSNIGLSQIRLLGATTFGETLFRTVNADVPDEEQLTKSSLGWLRLLHHCMGAPAPRLASLVMNSAASVPGLLEACCGMLLVPAPAPSLFAPHLEKVLLRLGLHSRSLGLRLIRTLLRNGTAAFLQGSIPSSAVVDSVVELLYQLCTNQDEATHDRVNTLVCWLHDTALTATQMEGAQQSRNMEVWPPPSAYIHCAAAILWSAFESGVNYDVQEMITLDLFSLMYRWTLTLPVQSALKKSVDTLLCSMCYVRPALFLILLQKMGVLIPSVSAARQNASDDSKDGEQQGGQMRASVSDDWKELVYESERGQLEMQQLRYLQLSDSELATIALACQSPCCLEHLLQSGMLPALTTLILEFCQRELRQQAEGVGGCSSSQREPAVVVDQSRMTDADKANNCAVLPMLKVDTIASVLNFFAEMCSEGMMRDWLGSPEGSVFWQPLLSLLCRRNSLSDAEQNFRRRYALSSEMYCALEAATIRFLSTCCSCHPSNQQLLSRVLCDVIGHHGSSLQSVSFLHGVSGFTRRLVLQLLLENEKVLVHVRASYPLHRGCHASPAGSAHHPRYGVGHQHQLLLTGTHTTLDDIVKMVAVPGSLGPLLGESKVGDGGSVQGYRSERRKDLWQLGIGLVDQLSMAAGVTAKDKRSKDAKNSAAAAAPKSPFAKKSRSSGAIDVTSPSVSVVSSLPVPELCVQHEACPGVSLPGQLTLSQLLYTMHQQGRSLSAPCVHLTVAQKDAGTKVDEQLLSCPGLPPPLQVFTQQGGLALLAQHLPLVYPDTMRHFVPDKAVPLEIVDGEWVKVDASDDIYEDIEDSVQVYTNVSAGVCPSNLPQPTVPPHSLAAFGLFLRLPGYAEVLLQDKKKAQCLLRLVLGVTDDGEGGDIFLSPVAGSLHTLPFQVLRQLFDSSPLSTDDGLLLRRTTVDVGAVHLLLACLSVFTHQSQDINLPGMQHELVLAATKASSAPHEGRGKSDDKSHLYWAKGTGFGTGSTVQSWNVEQALLRQRSEEEHVTVLLQVLSSFVNPGGGVPLNMLLDVDEAAEGDEDEEEEAAGAGGRGDGSQEPPQLPVVFHDLLQQSCLLPAICSYLRNDSVLDMARHIPLYRAVLQLLRAMALNPRLVSLLLPQTSRSSSADDLSVVCLLTKMKNVVDTYASRLNTNKSKGGSKGRSQNKLQEELESDEGLALLIPDIQETANLVQTATDRLVLEDDSDAATSKDAMFPGGMDYPLHQTLEERYLEVMKRLQFDTYEMITECPEGGYQFVVSYRFESHVRAAGERSHPSRVKRLAQETVTLSTSLPLSYSSSVFVRCDTDRLDIMKVLITGPAETPYANGCFEFDVYFPPDYPNSPMLINLETTGHHTIRFNPNLYNDGKVCLSVLNTWHGRPEEKWNAQTSSFLQVLVSIQSLILVPEPYFNEPGYERSRGTPSGNQSSREYNSNICQATVKWAMLEQIRNPCPSFKEVIHTHFWMKRMEIVSQIEGWIADMSQCGDKRTGRAISMNAMALTRHFAQLKEELAKLKVPEGQEDLASASWPPVAGPSQLPDASEPAAPAPAPAPAPAAELCSDSEMEKMVSKFCE